MTAKTNLKRDSSAKMEKVEKKQLDHDLDRELAESFPASDPPSLTQPAPRLGGPFRKDSGTR